MMRNNEVKELRHRISAAKGYLFTEALRVDEQWLKAAKTALDLLDKARIASSFDDSRLSDLCFEVQKRINQYIEAIDAGPLPPQLIVEHRSSMVLLSKTICRQLSRSSCTIN